MKKIATNFHEHRVLRSDLRRKLAVLELPLWLAGRLVLLRREESLIKSRDVCQIVNTHGREKCCEGGD